jgi:Protein of unknown function (DUF3592)
MTGAGWIGAIAAVLGGALTAAGAATGIHDRRLEKRGAKVPGTIVDVEKKSVPGRHSGPMQTPVFEFVAQDGTRVRKRSSVSSVIPTHAIGDLVMVWHDPAHPDRADIVGETRWMAPVMIGLGLVFVAVGVGVIVLAG